MHVTGELTRYAAQLNVALPLTGATYTSQWAILMERVQAEISRADDAAAQHRVLREAADRLATARERDDDAVQRVVEVAERKKTWDDRYAEARRRQEVAKEVREAATTARTRIVHRVFTRSLNDVWRSVFTRLAPNEGFIPRFGIPNANRTTFDITLETTRSTGEASGPPEMMLSAGNLNTAALSLFLALHLAVEPVVPCLVFDDPVQAMDEVHVAQFAGLIRLLAKQHGRQVVIAVHERELFDYLAFELSPAYEGDELITIELGERALDEDGGVTRHEWAADAAITG
jgi:exonuclease SbcC